MTWQQAGAPAFDGSLGYRVAFDPQDLDHVLVGALAEGVLVSQNGGASWTTATGLGSGNFNGFNLVVSPADSDIVWVQGLDLDDPNQATHRRIYRSEDGGLSFVAVVDAGPGIFSGDIPGLFERYHPLDGSPERAGAGIGLVSVLTLSAVSTSIDEMPGFDGRLATTTRPSVSCAGTARLGDVATSGQTTISSPQMTPSATSSTATEPCSSLSSTEPVSPPILRLALNAPERMSVSGSQRHEMFGSLPPSGSMWASMLTSVPPPPVRPPGDR